MKMDFDYRLLAKYLAGAISAEEMAMVVQWSSISEENKHIFSEIAKLRVAEGFTKYNNVERIDAALKMVNSRVNVKKRFTLLFSAMKYAAIVILVLVVAISGYTYLKPEKYYTIAVSEDTNVKKVLLSDGTTVWLHSNSSLQIPASFLKENRNVVLKGEAFFDVAKKQKNPFNVYTKYVRVRVLGTAFDVKVNEKAKSVETTLVRGHIALLNQDGEQVMKMDPGEKVTYTKDDNKYLTEDVDANLCAAWRLNQTIFENTTLREIAKKLSLKYNVNVNIESSELAQHKFRCVINQDESLAGILNLLKFMAPINYRIEGQEVFIGEDKINGHK